MKKKIFLLISFIFMFFIGFINIEAKVTGMCYYANYSNETTYGVSVLLINDNGKSADLIVLYANEKKLGYEVKQDEKISVGDWDNKKYIVNEGRCPQSVQYVNRSWTKGDIAYVYDSNYAYEKDGKDKLAMDNQHTCGESIQNYLLSLGNLKSPLVTLNQHYKTGGNENSTLTVYDVTNNDFGKNSIWYLYSTTGYCGIFRETGSAKSTAFLGTGNSDTDQTRAYSFDFPKSFEGKLISSHVTAKACTLNDLALGYACFGVEKYHIIQGGGEGLLDQPDPPKEEDKEDKYIGECKYTDDDGDAIDFKFYVTPESEYRYEFINVPDSYKQSITKSWFSTYFTDQIMIGGAINGNVKYEDITIENGKAYYPNISGDMYGDRKSEIVFVSPGDTEPTGDDVYIVECKQQKTVVPDPDPDPGMGDPVYGCEVIPYEIREWIQDALNLVKYIALALVIVLGALDFIKAATSGEADQMKKSGTSFLRRIIAVAILFLLPVIVDLILNLVEIYGADSTCLPQ